MKKVNIENENESQVNLKNFMVSFSVRKTAVRRRIRRITACMANPYVFRITQLFFFCRGSDLAAEYGAKTAKQ